MAESDSCLERICVAAGSGEKLDKLDEERLDMIEFRGQRAEVILDEPLLQRA